MELTQQQFHLSLFFFVYKHTVRLRVFTVLCTNVGIPTRRFRAQLTFTRGYEISLLRYPGSILRISFSPQIEYNLL